MGAPPDRTPAKLNMGNNDNTRSKAAGTGRAKRTLILLTYNEIHGATGLFDRLPLNCADEVFAVDGGSKDGTVEFLSAKGVRVVSQDRRGRGRAFTLGAREASGENLVFFSLDFNEDPADIPVLFDKLDQGADMVIASRMMAGAVNEEDARVIRLRKWVNQAFTLIVNAIWNRGPYITDTINGFRGITKKAFFSLNCDCDGFDIEFTMSIRALKAGMKIAEFPTHEYPRIGGVSTAESWPTGVLFVSRLFKELFSGSDPRRGGAA